MPSSRGRWGLKTLLSPASVTLEMPDAESACRSIELANPPNNGIGRPHCVENATGFVRMEVLNPCDAPDEIWLITYWDNEASYRTWNRSHLYQESHRGISKGLPLVPNSVSIRFFEHVASIE